jgi:hypothetical protein
VTHPNRPDRSVTCRRRPALGLCTPVCTASQQGPTPQHHGPPPNRASGRDATARTHPAPQAIDGAEIAVQAVNSIVAAQLRADG